jgi:hypothetical protein
MLSVASKVAKCYRSETLSGAVCMGLFARGFLGGGWVTSGFLPHGGKTSFCGNVGLQQLFGVPEKNIF